MSPKRKVVKAPPRRLQLLFDSLSSPLNGRRCGLLSPRQIMYRLGATVIDIRLEPAPNSHHMDLTGQISFETGQRKLDGIVVTITSPASKIAETRTNEFGEFHLTYTPEIALSVIFDGALGQPFRVPLDTSDLPGRRGKRRP